MKFTYKQNDYELIEMVEPGRSLTFGILAIFRVHYIKWDSNDNKIEVLNNEEYDMEEYEFINYFCDQEDDDNFKFAKEYIDEYLESLRAKNSTIEKTLSIIKDYYMIDKDFFELDRRKEIEENIKDLEKIVTK